MDSSQAFVRPSSVPLRSVTTPLSEQPKENLSEQAVVLDDGRILTYTEFGRSDGEPVFYFHGSPSSRLEPLLIGTHVIEETGLRVIAPNRPGVGHSTFKAGRSFSDWPRDVLALADHLRLPRFSVWAFSGGAPYACVCAATIPERLNNVVTVSGAWRMDIPSVAKTLQLPNRLMVLLSRRIPILLGLMFRLMAKMGQNSVEKELATVKTRIAPPDYNWFVENPQRFKLLSLILREALSCGTRGAVHDMGLYMRPLDFELDKVRMRMTCFHGVDDINYPIEESRRVVGLIPDATFVACPSEAHLSLLSHHLNHVVAALRKPKHVR
jgi:pimeloyl-ACP methyl ester carboxylesterase